MSEPRTRMINDMVLRRFSPCTQQSYLGAVNGLAAHYHTPPDQLDPKLKVKTSLGTSRNALEVQLWTALIATLLVSYLHWAEPAGLVAVESDRAVPLESRYPIWRAFFMGEVVGAGPIGPFSVSHQPLRAREELYFGQECAKGHRRGSVVHAWLGDCNFSKTGGTGLPA